MIESSKLVICLLPAFLCLFLMQSICHQQKNCLLKSSLCHAIFLSILLNLKQLHTNSLEPIYVGKCLLSIALLPKLFVVVQSNSGMFFVPFHHILFPKGPVLVHQNQSRKFWWSGLVLKDLKWLGPLIQNTAHYKNKEEENFSQPQRAEHYLKRDHGKGKGSKQSRAENFNMYIQWQLNIEFYFIFKKK